MGFCLEVKGDYACFTRPEMKVERVSYDVITPSAARAIFEAILWKPAIEWSVGKIEVLAPIEWVSIRRNELGSVISSGNINKAMRGGAMPVLDIESERQQRASLLLRDVHYRLHAHFQLSDRAGSGDNAAKFADMFKRRAQKGQCFHQPYLGCREFPCQFELIENQGAHTTLPIAQNLQLGWMLYDIDYTQKEAQPLFFNATLKGGVLHVPPKNSSEVRR